MNLYRFLASLFIVALAILLLAAGGTLAELAGGEGMTSEIRTGLVVLVVVMLLVLVLLLFLLCLGRAKARLQNEKRLYREAHGEDHERRKSAEVEMRRLAERKLEYGRCARICDMLVRRKFPRDCVRLPFDVTRRPDPCIYSQFFLRDNGQPVTWDNPNVEIRLQGVPQDTYNLAVDTEYEVRIGIENASPLFDALGTDVEVNLLTFGIGGPSPSLIHSFQKDIPAATPFPGVIESFTWTSPEEEGHYCIQVLISHPDDVNPANNEGWNNTEVRDVDPGENVRRNIPVWNPVDLDKRMKSGARERFARMAFTVDSYELQPEQLPDGDLNTILAPRPALWGARVTPTDMTLEPGHQQKGEVALEVTVPADAEPGTTAVFNVSATAGGRAVGGVSLRLNVS